MNRRGFLAMLGATPLAIAVGRALASLPELPAPPPKNFTGQIGTMSNIRFVEYDHTHGGAEYMAMRQRYHRTRIGARAYRYGPTPTRAQMRAAQSEMFTYKHLNRSVREARPSFPPFGYAVMLPFPTIEKRCDD